MAEGWSVRWALAVAALGCSGLTGCSRDTTKAADLPRYVVRQYVTNLDANYKDSVRALESLRSAVDAFVSAPSEAGLLASRAAWLVAHQTYGQGEVSRFYGGPIDRAQVGMNEWPIDESFIDYTLSDPNGGIVNSPADFPQISAPALVSADEKGVETVSTGFHAIEFLLWGQRADQKQGPGTRAYTDFVDGGTAAHQDRRRDYLRVATAMLEDDMRALAGDWDPSDPKSYGAKFAGGDPHEALTKLFRGFSQMAISELYYERMLDAVVSLDRKDEESCFSESTNADLVANAIGLENVYLGRYRTSAGETLAGPSVSDLVRARDAGLDAELRGELSAVRKALEAIPPPFDHAIFAPPSSAPNRAVQAALSAFQPVQETIGRAANRLGVINNL